MSLLLPNRKLAQPVIGPSPIPGVRALFDMRYGVDLINGQFASANSATQLTGIAGQTHDFSGTANVQFAHHPNYAITGPISIIAMMDVDALTNYGAIIAKQRITTADMPYELRLGNGATDSKINFLRGGATIYAGAFMTTAVITAGMSKVMVVVTSSSDQCDTVSAMTINGFTRPTTSISPSGSGSKTVTDDGSSVVWIGRRSDGATQLDGRIYWIALLERAIDQSEHIDIWADPTILFPTQPRRARVGAVAVSDTLWSQSWF